MVGATFQALVMDSAAALGPPVLTFGTSSSSTANLTTYSFSLDIGTASANRMVVAAFSWDNGAAALSSATINGVAATIIAQSGTTTGAAIVAAIVTTGSGAQTVDFTLGAGALRAAAGTWWVTNKTTVTAFDTDAVNGTGVTLDFPADGCVVTASGRTNTTVTTTTGVTENYDLAVESALRAAGGSLTGQSASSGNSITMDNASGGRVVGASWGSG